MADAYPHFYTAASLIKTVRRMALRNVRMMTDVAQRYHPLMEKHFPKLHIHTIEIVEPEPETGAELAQLMIDPIRPKPTDPNITITVNYS
jgi:hypothetical protein